MHTIQTGQTRHLLLKFVVPLVNYPRGGNFPKNLIDLSYIVLENRFNFKTVSKRNFYLNTLILASLDFLDVKCANTFLL